jgi:hypothetical protein
MNLFMTDLKNDKRINEYAPETAGDFRGISVNSPA